MSEIFVVVEHRLGEIRDITYEMLWKAGDLAEKLSHSVTAVLLGHEVGCGAVVKVFGFFLFGPLVGFCKMGCRLSVFTLFVARFGQIEPHSGLLGDLMRCPGQCGLGLGIALLVKKAAAEGQVGHGVVVGTGPGIVQSRGRPATGLEGLESLDGLVIFGLLE